MFVKSRFHLNPLIADSIRRQIPKFGYNGFGELTFYRTYSRMKSDGGQESWGDVVVRVTEGTFSIRKDFYLKNYIPWDEAYWQGYARGFAQSMFDMKWMPPGRGLWAMGSDFVYERGSMALNNCGFTLLGGNDTFGEDVCWLMDSLMHGVGVGFAPVRDGLQFKDPKGTYPFLIPDSREGWVDCLRRVIFAFVNGTALPLCDPKDVRGPGEPIKGFGGVSSGPLPLMNLLLQVVEQCVKFLKNEVDVVEFKTNVANMIGCCVVAGNVRRSAEIACGSIHDRIFMDLKNYDINPQRAAFGWMSNNTVFLDEDRDFDCLGEISLRCILNGEPGVANRRNFKYGQIGKHEIVRVDKAIGLNPCGEIALEDKELCNVAETLPTMCVDHNDWLKACEYATFYCSTTALLPTHQAETNRVLARNRRIGVSIIDFTGWKFEKGVHKVTKYLRLGTAIVDTVNRELAAEAGVPESIRKRAMKPGGTTPKLAGKTPSCGYPTFDYTLRRIRVAQNAPIHPLMVAAGIPYEKDFYSDNTDVFEYPILQGPAKPAMEASLWEQALNVVLLQREWADNAVSNTLYFRPKWKLTEHFTENIEAGIKKLVGDYAWSRLQRDKVYHVEATIKIVLSEYDAKVYEYDPTHEEDDIEPVLSSVISQVKSLSLLPHTAVGVYKQMPEEGISVQEYEERLAAIRPIDWSLFGGSDGMDERYCTGSMCENPNLGNANK